MYVAVVASYQENLHQGERAWSRLHVASTSPCSEALFPAFQYCSLEKIGIPVPGNEAVCGYCSICCHGE